MGGILILTFILVVGPLAVLYGIDSRPYEARQRPAWPGTPR
jgi:hypothetical protein